MTDLTKVRTAPAREKLLDAVDEQLIEQLADRAR
jgi:hypothetical protein